MPIHFYSRKYRLQLALRIDNESRPHYPHALFAIHVFLLPCAIGFKSLVVRIAREWKIQLILVPKLCQLFRRVGTHSHDFCTELVEFLFGVTKLVSLLRSARSVGLWKEIQYERGPFKIAEAYGLTGIRQE
jgi:hypothetical protein